MRLSITGCLPQSSGAGTSGSPRFRDSVIEVGIAAWSNEPEELGSASPDVRDGIGEVKES